MFYIISQHVILNYFIFARCLTLSDLFFHRCFAQAVDVCVALTGASAAYVAAVEDSAPLGLKAAVVTCKEPSGGTRDEEEEAEVDEPGEGAGGDAGEAMAKGVSGRMLQYIVASAGQEWLVRDGVELRPRPAPDGVTDEDAPQPQLPLEPPCLRMLASDAAAISIDNVAYDSSVTFFRRMPRVGALHAVAVRAGATHALLCCDTLLPGGSGAPLSSSDRCVRSWPG